MSNWLHNLIGPFTTPPKLAKIPFVDDPEGAVHAPTSAAVRAATDAFLRKKEQEETWYTIFGEPLAKSPPAGLDNRSLQDDTQPRQGESKFPDLPRATDPRRKTCFCSCPNCVRQDCRNCVADEKCEFAHIGVLDDILPVDPETEAELRQAARNRQVGRLRKARVAKHREGLEPAIRKFRNQLPYSSSRIDAALEAVSAAMAQYVTCAVAGEF